MSEADLVFGISAAYDRIWVMVQWWASVSFGLIVASHFAADRLNLLFVTLLVVLYWAFTAWMGAFLQYNVGILNGYITDLGLLIESGKIEHQGTIAYVDSTEFWLGTFFQYATLLFMFAGTNLYIAYAYRTAQTGKSEDAA